MRSFVSFRALSASAILALGLLAMSPAAYAACASPAGVVGEIIYNTDYSVVQYCDGTYWVGMAGGGASPSGGISGLNGDVSASGSGVVATTIQPGAVTSGKIADTAVTYAKIQNTSAANVILGRGSAGGAGPVQELTIGSGLTLTGTTLTASGTGADGATAGLVQFRGATAGSFLSDATAAGQFFWDVTNHRLGVGTVTPAEAIDVNGKVTSTKYVFKAVTGATAPLAGSGLWTTNGTNVWRAAGNVGVGTPTPGSRLTIADDNDMAIRLDRSTAASWSYLGFYTGNVRRGTVGSDPSNNMSLLSDSGLTFYAGAAERMRITSGGNVGIGTTSPTFALDVVGNSRISYPSPVFIVKDTSNIFSANAYVGYISFQDSTGSEVAYVGDGTPADNLFRVWSNKAIPMSFGTNGAEQIRLGTNGNVGMLGAGASSNIGLNMASSNYYGIYYASPANAYGIFATMSHAGGVAVSGDNSNTGARGALGYAGYGVYCVSGTCGGAQNWAGPSDIRLKTNIADLPDNDGIDAIMKLRPVTFHWRDDQKDKTRGEQLGFIAQEIEKVYPQTVLTGGDVSYKEKGVEKTVYDGKSMSYADMVVPLVKAVQQLKAENDDLRKRLEALEAKQ